MDFQGVWRRRHLLKFARGKSRIYSHPLTSFYRFKWGKSISDQMSHGIMKNVYIGHVCYIKLQSLWELKRFQQQELFTALANLLGQDCAASRRLQLQALNVAEARRQKAETPPLPPLHQLYWLGAVKYHFNGFEVCACGLNCMERCNVLFNCNSSLIMQTLVSLVRISEHIRGHRQLISTSFTKRSPKNVKCSEFKNSSLRKFKFKKMYFIRKKLIQVGYVNSREIIIGSVFIFSFLHSIKITCHNSIISFEEKYSNDSAYVTSKNIIPHKPAHPSPKGRNKHTFEEQFSLSPSFVTISAVAKLSLRERNQFLRPIHHSEQKRELALWMCGSSHKKRRRAKNLADERFQTPSLFAPCCARRSNFLWWWDMKKKICGGWSESSVHFYTLSASLCIYGEGISLFTAAITARPTFFCLFSSPLTRQWWWK